MKKKSTKILLGVILVLVALYFMPLVTTSVATPDGLSFQVPVLSFYKDTCCRWYVATFQSPRSTYALEKDVKNALATYEEMTCRGEHYYYDAAQDLSLVQVTVTGGFPMNEVAIEYNKGNACAGWTVNDEAKYPFGDTSSVPASLTEAEAIEKGYMVLDDQGNTLAVGQYNAFMLNVNNMLPGYLRIIKETDTGFEVIDVQFFDDQKVAVTVDTTFSEEEGTVTTTNYDRIGTTDVGGKSWLVVFNGNDSNTEDRFLLANVDE